MNDDEASRLSLEYSGSQSPLPPSPVLPKDHRYFGHAGAEAQPSEDAQHGGRSCDRDPEGATAADPLRMHRARRCDATAQDHSAVATVPLDGRTAAQHRTEHRRQGEKGRDVRRSGADQSTHGSRDITTRSSGAEDSERRSSARDSSSRQRRHSPVPRRQRSSPERDTSARRPGSGSGRSRGANHSDSVSGRRKRIGQPPEPTPDQQRSRLPARRQHGRSPPPGHGRWGRGSSLEPSCRRRSWSPDEQRRRSVSPPRQLRHDAHGQAKHRQHSSRAADGRADANGSQRGVHRHRSPAASSDDQRQRHSPDAAVRQLPPEAIPAKPLRQQADDARLDFCSSQFDALLALYTPGLQLPNPRAAPLNFVMQCRNLLPPEDENWLPPVDRSMPSKSQLARQAQESRTGNAAAAAAKAAAREAPLDTIAASIQAGPLMLLKQAYEARGAVRVVTRHARGVRGVATGTLLGFDKHMNLILRDVEETYTVLVRVCRQLPPRTPAAAHSPTAGSTRAQPPSLSTARESAQPAAGPATERPEPAAGDAVAAQGRCRWGRKQEVRRRSLRQVFVRGDNIVLVSRASASEQPENGDARQRPSSQQLGTIAQVSR